MLFHYQCQFNYDEFYIFRHHKSKKKKKQLMQCIRWGIVSVKLTKHQVIPLPKSVKRSKIVCSFKDGFIIPINNASRFYQIWLLDGALHNIDQSNKCLIWFFICCAGSDL